MTARINKLARRTGSDIYFEPGFRRVIEDHLSLLLDNEDTEIVPIDDIDTQKYRGDYYGLLQFYRVPINHRWIAMRMAGLTNPTSYNGESSIIYRPPRQAVLSLVQRYRTSK